MKDSLKKLSKKENREDCKVYNSNSDVEEYDSKSIHKSQTFKVKRESNSPVNFDQHLNFENDHDKNEDFVVHFEPKFDEEESLK